MSDFNFNKYLKNNPLLKETSGYGNYTRPETMLEDNDYISGEEYDNMTDDEIDAAELAGRLEPRDKPLGPDEELMEADTLSKSILNGVNSLKAKGLSNDEIMEVCQMSLDQLSSKSIIPQAMAFLKKHTLHGGIQIMQGIADLMDQGLSYGEILDVCEGDIYG